MSITDLVKRRGITDILHFTTNRALVGCLQTGALLSRERLPKEAYLEHILMMNCAARKDIGWLDYVNLSVSWVNPRLFGISRDAWHRGKDLWWCVLVFDPIITTHPGVHFTTTNNMYSGVQRGTGEAGFDALFAPSVVQYVDWQSKRPTSTITRLVGYPEKHPTDPQAEVLYPKSLSLEYLTAVYVPNEDTQDRAMADLYMFDNDTKVIVRPELFGSNAKPVD